MNDIKLSAAKSYASVTSTPVNGSHIIDLEEVGVTDEQISGWLNVVVLDDVSVSALTEGLIIKLKTSDSSSLASGNVDVVSSGIILPARLVKGFRQSYGFHMAKCHRYLGNTVEAVNTSEGGGTLKLDVWWSESPLSQLAIQKGTTSS